MTEIVTYHSINAKHSEAWLAFVVLPNGSYWQVRFVGETEEVARQKAADLWATEQSKFAMTVRSVEPNGKVKTIDDPWKEVKTHHLAGKIWMFNKTTGDRTRIMPTEEYAYRDAGYERGGPRSK